MIEKASVRGYLDGEGSGMNEKKDPLKEIQRKINGYSQTDEYKIKKRFSQLGYATSNYYYRFEDKDKNKLVVRELDIVATKYFTKKINNSKKTISLSFIADVKFPERHNKIYVTGLKSFDPREFQLTTFLKNLKIESLEDIPNLIDKYWHELIPIIPVFSTHFFPFLNLLSAKSTLENLSILMPIFFDLITCFNIVGNLWLFDEKGNEIYNEKTKKKSKRDLRAFCEQISSGFHSYVQKSRDRSPKTAEDLNSKDISNISSFTMQFLPDMIHIIIPILIFANEIEILVVTPEKGITDEKERIDELIYTFQPTTDLKELIGYTIPILFTSAGNLENTIKKIERMINKTILKE